MPGDIKPEQLLFESHSLRFAPSWRLFRPLCSRGRQQVAEERYLTGRAIAMRSGRGGKRLFHTRDQLRTIATEKIECAAFRPALEAFSVRDSSIKARTKTF